MSAYRNLVFRYFILIAFISGASSLTCHVCAGADSAPTYDAVNIIDTLNISFPVHGNCKDKASSCSEGLFCTKRTVLYDIKYEKMNFKYTTYEKGCFKENKISPKIGCKDVDTSSTATYKKTIRECYCKKDFCNSINTLRFITSFLLTFIILFINL